MRLVLLGAPGSGKGTQAARLTSEFGVPHISTGDLLRAAVAEGTPLGLEAKAVMDAGHLVSDATVLGMLENRLGRTDVADGFILDGYPRNLAQAAALEQLLQRLGQPLSAVVKLEVPSEVIVERTALRARDEGRTDDTPETVRKRLQIYQEQTAPLADHYAKIHLLKVVDGIGQIEEIFSRILEALQRSQLVAD